jgi:hypothetical protein
MTKNNGAINILKQNAWPLIVVIAGWLVGFALLQARVSTLEAKVSEYPSQDFFSERFKNIDEKFVELQKQISELKVEVRLLK